VEDVNDWVISPVSSHSTHDAAPARPKAYSQGAFDGFPLVLLALRSAFFGPIPAAVLFKHVPSKVKHQVVNIAEAVPLLFSKGDSALKNPLPSSLLVRTEPHLCQIAFANRSIPRRHKKGLQQSMFLLDFRNRPQTTCQSSRHTSSDMRALSLPPVSRSSPASSLGL
jgi:hypothetical protein